MEDPNKGAGSHPSTEQATAAGITTQGSWTSKDIETNQAPMGNAPGLHPNSEEVAGKHQHTKDQDDCCPKPTIEDQLARRIRECLPNLEAEWFIDHDCLSDEMKKLIEAIKGAGDQLKMLLESGKSEIESSIERMQLTGLKRESGGNIPFRCVLLGKTGEGKSSLGNLLICREEFGVGDTAKSETHTIQYKQAADLEIIDTPGFGDPNKTVDAGFELTKIFDTFKEGIHAFIYVFGISNPRVTEADVDIFRKIKDIFGEKMKYHTILVLTHSGNQLSKENGSLKEFVARMKDTELGNIFDIIGDQVIAVDNKSKGYKRQLHREGVINMMSMMVQQASQNGYEECYTPTFFNEAKYALEETRRIRREKLEVREREAEETVLNLLVGLLADKDVNKLFELNDSEGKQVSLIEGVIASVPFDLREHAQKEGKKILKQQVDNKLHEIAQQLVETEVSNCSSTIEYYYEKLQNDDDRLVQAVGTENILAMVGMKHRSLCEKQADKDRLAKIKEMEEKEAQAERERQAIEARLARHMKAKVRSFVTKNIAMHKRTDRIVEILVEENRELFGTPKTRDTVQQFLWSREGKALVDNHLKSERDRLRREAISEMERHIRISIGEYLSEQTRAEMEKCKKDEASRRGNIELIVNQVKENLGKKHLDSLSVADIKGTVEESFTESINNVTNATIRERIRMTFSFLFGKDHTKEIMAKYVQVKDAFKKGK